MEWSGRARAGTGHFLLVDPFLGGNDPFNANTERCLAKPIFKRNGEAQSLCACPPSRRAQIPTVFRRNYKTAGIAPFNSKYNLVKAERLHNHIKFIQECRFGRQRPFRITTSAAYTSARKCYHLNVITCPIMRGRVISLKSES